MLVCHFLSWSGPHWLEWTMHYFAYERNYHSRNIITFCKSYRFPLNRNVSIWWGTCRLAIVFKLFSCCITYDLECAHERGRGGSSVWCQVSL